jgi:hypothetical protein
MEDKAQFTAIHVEGGHEIPIYANSKKEAEKFLRYHGIDRLYKIKENT